MNSRFTHAQIAGIVIATSSLISMVLITHHPTISAQELSMQVTESAIESQLNGIVHGGLIGLLITNLLAFTVYSTLRGLTKLLVLSALITYFICTIFMTIAALVNGFIFPGFLHEVALHQQDLLQYTPLIRVFSWNINQALANTSVVGTSIAIVFWSINLIHSNWLQKSVALGGILVGAAIIVLLLSGLLHLDLSGMTLVVTTQSLWSIALAYLLFFKKLTKS